MFKFLFVLLFMLAGPAWAEMDREEYCSVLADSTATAALRRAEGLPEEVFQQSLMQWAVQLMMAVQVDVLSEEQAKKLLEGVKRGWKSKQSPEALHKKTLDNCKRETI